VGVGRPGRGGGAAGPGDDVCGQPGAPRAARPASLPPPSQRPAGSRSTGEPPGRQVARGAARAVARREGPGQACRRTFRMGFSDISDGKLAPLGGQPRFPLSSSPPHPPVVDLVPLRKQESGLRGWPAQQSWALQLGRTRGLGGGPHRAALL
jgi:hypothetical protein